MTWTIIACLALIDVCLSACLWVQMRMIDSLFRSLSTEYRINADNKSAEKEDKKHYSMYKAKGES